MSVLIRGMAMPTSTKYVDVRIFSDGRATTATGNHPFYREMEVIELPPHKDLIDREDLRDALERTEWYHQNKSKDMAHGANSAEHQAWYKEQDVYAAVDNAPAVIEAEGVME